MRAPSQPFGRRVGSLTGAATDRAPSNDDAETIAEALRSDPAPRPVPVVPNEWPDDEPSRWRDAAFLALAILFGIGAFFLLGAL